jgi:hypothetical protein
MEKNQVILPGFSAPTFLSLKFEKNGGIINSTGLEQIKGAI